jgi:tetratricopeptide (TPR) repeat protein
MTGDDLYPAIVRATALTLLSSYPGPESRRAFAAALVDEDPLVRYTAVNSVETEELSELVEVLIPLLFDPVRAVRLQTAVRLADTPDALLKPYQRKALDGALTDYRRAMEYSLDFSFAGHNLGNLAVRLGNNVEAEQHYREAIAIDDLFFPAKVNLAVLLSSQGKNEEAEALLREVLEAYPEQHQVAYSLGLLVAEMGRYSEAEALLARASEGMPGHAGAQRNLAEIRRFLASVEQSEIAKN